MHTHTYMNYVYRIIIYPRLPKKMATAWGRWMGTWGRQACRWAVDSVYLVVFLVVCLLV